MAKHYDVNAARARRKKAAEKQAQKEREMWLKLRKPLAIGAAAVVAILVIWWIAATFIFVPANSVRVAGGNTLGVQDNWIVTNMGNTNKPLYFHMADMKTPAGYTENKDYSVSPDKNVKTHYYDADDKDAMIRAVYVAGVSNKTAADMAQQLSKTNFFVEEPEVLTRTVNGRELQCISGLITGVDENGADLEGEGTRNVYCYMDGIQGSSVVMMISSQQAPYEQLPSTEDMLANLDTLLPNLTLTK